jgi:hypothetical protein
MEIKNGIRKAAIAGLASLVLGATLFTEYKANVRESTQREMQERAFKKTQEDLLAVEMYIRAIENPEDFDGFYSLGWGMQVPDRYQEFIKNYVNSRILRCSRLRSRRQN